MAWHCAALCWSGIYNRPLHSLSMVEGVVTMSLSSSDADGQERFALGFLFALITLVVATVVGVAVYQRGMARAPVAALAAAVDDPANEAVQGPVVVLAAHESAVIVDGKVVKFYFAVNKAEIGPGAKEALGDVLRGVVQGKKAQISGYHDAQGDLAANQELAKQRAFAVRDALMFFGATEEAIVLKKPEQTLASGDDAHARRVEVTLLP